MPPTLPTSLPADTTPAPYSSTNWHLYLLDDNATSVVQGVTITTGASAASGATSITVTALPNAIPSGTVLNFGGVPATLTADAASGATTLAVSALSGAIASGATATYSNLTEVPVSEQFNVDMPNDEETIKVFGRTTPIRVVNGKDLTMTVRTIAGITDPTVKRLQIKGRRISPNNRQRVVLLCSDGYAILAMVNVSGKPVGQPGQSQRWEFAMNLSGDMYDANLNDTTPAWAKIGN